MQITTVVKSQSPQIVKGHETWSSRFTFLMASVGFAVGLGNIWRFPYLTGENGGGAFVVVYLLCIFAIGLPILMAEIMIGRRGRQSPNVSMGKLACEEGASEQWHWLGAMTMLTSFLILIVYSVVAGWVLRYLYLALFEGFLDLANSASSSALFTRILTDSTEMIFWTALALTITSLIVGSGIKNGIERAVTVLMPMLFILLIVMVGYAAYAGDFEQGLRFLFVPDFSKIDSGTILIALGQAFFSVGVAMGAMMTYGAYLPQDVSIGRSAFIIVFADTLVALLAGMVIFPLVFQHGIDPQGGTGLVFEALPLAFTHMPGGYFFATIFFMLLSVAAITSMVGHLEPLVSWAEEHQGINRRKGSLCLCLIVLLLSLLSIYSYNHLSDLQIFGGKNFTDAISFLTDQVTMPIGGLLIALFAGWVMSQQTTENELALANRPLYQLWKFLIRYVVPVALFSMLVFGHAS